MNGGAREVWPQADVLSSQLSRNANMLVERGRNLADIGPTMVGLGEVRPTWPKFGPKNSTSAGQIWPQPPKLVLTWVKIRPMLAESGRV